MCSSAVDAVDAGDAAGTGAVVVAVAAVGVVIEVAGGGVRGDETFVAVCRDG